MFADSADRSVSYAPDTQSITLRIKVSDPQVQSTGFYMDIILTYAANGILPDKVEFEIEGTSFLFASLLKLLQSHQYPLCLCASEPCNSRRITGAIFFTLTCQNWFKKLGFSANICKSLVFGISG